MKRPIVAVAGVRPQYIKATAFAWEMRQQFFDNDLYVADTAQHYSPELSLSIIEELALPIHLHVLHRKPRLPWTILSTSINELSKFLACLQVRPVVVVFGDANPALAGAMAALKTGCPLVHVEAGARRDPREQEHHNSRLVDAIADLKFCLTPRAAKALATENSSSGTILTGDLAIGWFRHYCANLETDPLEEGHLLVSLHRPENSTRPRIQKLLKMAREYTGTVKWIEHPRTRDILSGLAIPANVEIVPPLGYEDALRSILSSRAVLTDSGGLSREAHHLRRPVLMRRDRGGWPELLESGQMRRIGFNPSETAAAFSWADLVAESYPHAHPLVVEDGIEQGMNALRALARSPFRRHY